MPRHSSVERLPQHLPELDGLRAVAALGIIVTHASFQTGTGWAFADRFDYFVAVFFALSAFLLWRRRDVHTTRRYFHSRLARLAPAYLCCVLVVLALFPAEFTLPQVLVNLTGTQIYIDDGLAPGLTHLWSLCVEFAFYAVLPVLASALGAFRRPLRVALIAGAAMLSLGWGFLPFVADYAEDQVNSQIWPPAYTAWFAVGMLTAEAEASLRRRIRPRTARVLRGAAWLAAAGCMWLASREWFGPAGLVHPEPAEFARRIAVGTLFAACVVTPVALAPLRTTTLRSNFVQALGRWSYSIFLWHVAMLGVAFPLTGISPFSGSTWDFCVIFATTLALTIPLSAVSYEMVERPGRKVLSRVLASPRHGHGEANATARRLQD